MSELILVRGIWGAGIPDDFGVVVGTQTEDPGKGCTRVRWMTRGDVVELFRHIKTEDIPPHSNVGVWRIHQGDNYYDMALQVLLDGHDDNEEVDGNPVYHGKPLVDVLTELKRRGLTQADVLSIYGVPRDENPYASFIQNRLANDHDMELDDNVLLSETDDGCWVSCWCYVEDEAIGINRLALTLVVDLDERGIFKAHVEDYVGDSIFELSNENEDGSLKEDGIDLVRDGYLRHRRDTYGLLNYLREIGIATKENTLTVSG
ncbi:hypothetical protein GGI1_03386 [Acidithiobacillus sp. GGI-221]|nr:hypothetical protein GGI1_03386 [Acidithiobacillus sp. GGI-221]